MTALLLVALLAAALPGGAAGGPPNILLLIADDLGIDRVASYGAHPDPGHTPVIDQLAAEGMQFRNVWSNPYCSATRATMLTGRHSYRTGIGSFLSYDGYDELSVAETALPQALPPGYRTAAVGKWHLSAGLGSGLAHPMLLGFEHHHGSINNLSIPEELAHGSESVSAYFAWKKNIDGVAVTSETYATTDTVDEALALIARFSAEPAPEPWFLWVAFNAPHKPYHAPPGDLHSFDLPPEVAGNEPVYMKALTEAMDTEIGRLLSSMDPDVRANTIVIFVGDNGTHADAITAPAPVGHGKGTVYEGGVRVPLIIQGPGVRAGRESSALVNTTDLFATVAELAGGVSTAEDSVSLVPYLGDPALPSQRAFLYAERFTPDHTTLHVNRRRAVRGPRFKLRQVEAWTQLVEEQLFDLDVDPHERHDLLAAGPLSSAAQAAYDELLAELSTHQPAPAIWTNLSHGQPGTSGIPALAGSGTLREGDEVELKLSQALPSTPAFFLLGFSYVLVPAWGGTVVPSPDLLLTPVTDAAGSFSVGGEWPADVPSGLSLYYQVWQPDPAGLLGYATSNALLSTTP